MQLQEISNLHDFSLQLSFKPVKLLFPTENQNKTEKIEQFSDFQKVFKIHLK